MRSSRGKANFGPMLLKSGVSMVALTAMAAALAGSVYAQDAAKSNDTAAGDGKEVVVVGVRRSLKSAQQIKRDADMVVDSITATDIGAFPDKSVAEALQRVAGITVSRFAAATDTAHFSAEPSGVLVRGLTQVRSEFNGRDVFSANSSRGLSWGDVSPELMSGVDTYKNQTADLIEGGIAGSINLRTRVPFDSKGQLIALSADASYGDLAKKWTPDISGIYSNRWDTSAGEFGLMVNYAYSDVSTTSQGVQNGRMGIFCSSQNPADLNTCDANQFGTHNTDSTHNFAYVPVSVADRDNNFDRKRNGVAFAAQWQPHDHSMLATLQYNNSKYENEWHEHVVTASFFDVWAQPLGYQFSNNTAVNALPGSPLSFDSNGLFQSGVLTSDIGWWGTGAADSATVAANSSGQAMVYPCYGNADNSWSVANDTCQVGTNGSGRRGAGIGTATRYNHNNENTEDLSFNFKWDVNDHLKTNFDVQYVNATVTNYDIEIDMNSFANVLLDNSGTYPKMTILAPTNVNQSAGGLTNPDNYYYNSVMDHTEDSKGNEFATRFDVQYSFDGGWVDSIKAGVRYADREQHVNWSTYNWKNIANTYSCNKGVFNVDHTTPQDWTCPNGDVFHFEGYKPGLYEVDSFGSSLLHQKDLISAHQFTFFNYSVLENRQALSAAMSQAALSAGATKNGIPTNIGSWIPICDRTNEVANSCYTSAEIMDIDEKTEAAYLELKFGGNDHQLFGFPVQGNVGVRYVQTTDTSTGGGIKYPDAFEYNSNNCDGSLTALQIANANALGRYPVFAPCLVHHSVDDVAFRDGVITSDPQFPSVVKSTHGNFLPSFNVKFNLTDQWLLRFAASRAMSRPDMGYLRNYFYITGSTLSDSELAIGNPNIVLGDGNTSTNTSSPAYNTACPVGTACSYKGFRYTASAGNPRLKPTLADQFDLTVEDYFGSVGSFTFDLFYKQFHDYIQNGTRQVVSLTHNGVTRDVLVTGPVNGEGASMKGFEVAYQRFFDFLPAPFNGLGIQANYTHVQNTGIKNAGLGSTTAGGAGLGTGGGGVNSQYDNITVDRLEGLSDNAYNLIGMYEKGPWALRAAYNWRSKFLVTAADCCVGFPIWQKAAGYLDASARYKVSDNIEISIQGSNLLNTDTVLMQQVDNRGTLLPNAWFENDRRVQVGVRLKY